MKIPSPRSNRRARIEIIPLIDIMFFLLATFIMVSTSMIKNQGIPVKIPTATTSAPQDRQDDATISVTEKGDVYFNRELVNISQLSSRLQNLKAKTTDPKIFINGDENALFGHAVAVLDAVRQLGITKIAIETRKPQ